MENALRTNPLDIREQYEKKIKQLQEAHGEAMLEPRAKKIAAPAGRVREVTETIRRGLKEESVIVSISPQCRWFEVPGRTFYYRSVTTPPKVQHRLAEPANAMICLGSQEHRSEGVLTAWLAD